MAEKNITCPNCFDTKRCFEETVVVPNTNPIKKFSSYMCFNCGYMSNTLYKNDTAELEKLKEISSELMNDVSMYDYDRKIHWFPSVLNMGELGIIYPDGTKDNWSWKYASVRKLSKKEQKDPAYKGHEHTLDMENAKEYGQHEFVEACKDMGIIKDI